MPHPSPARQRFLEQVKRDEAYIYDSVTPSPDLLVLIWEKGTPDPP